jgi:hypothetical protein
LKCDILHVWHHRSGGGQVLHSSKTHDLTPTVTVPDVKEAWIQDLTPS